MRRLPCINQWMQELSAQCLCCCPQGADPLLAAGVACTSILAFLFSLAAWVEWLAYTNRDYCGTGYELDVSWVLAVAACFVSLLTTCSACLSMWILHKAVYIPHNKPSVELRPL